MTSVNMPRDDASIKLDPKTVAKRDVKQVEAYPETPPVKEDDKAPVATPPVRPKRQRRQGDRRQKDVPVLLDTRSGRDRRKSAADGEDEPPPHIDVHV